MVKEGENNSILLGSSKPRLIGDWGFQRWSLRVQHSHWEIDEQVDLEVAQSHVVSRAKTLFTESKNNTNPAIYVQSPNDEVRSRFFEALSCQLNGLDEFPLESTLFDVKKSLENNPNGENHILLADYFESVLPLDDLEGNLDKTLPYERSTAVYCLASSRGLKEKDPDWEDCCVTLTSLVLSRSEFRPHVIMIDNIDDLDSKTKDRFTHLTLAATQNSERVQVVYGGAGTYDNKPFPPFDFYNRREKVEMIRIG